MLQNLFSPNFIFYVITIPISLVFHEFAHAWMADRLGDNTARLAGRLSLNPLVHLDPLGLILILFGPIGWAKPVPVDVSRLRHGRRDLMFVALAGPASNLLLAVVCFLVLRVVPVSGFSSNGLPAFALQLLTWGAVVNVTLCVFNLIPVPPLDGSRVVSAWVPYRHMSWHHRYETYGPFLLLLVVVIPPLRNTILSPMLNASWQFVASWFGFYTGGF
ncbi:site-2 protease family protein [Alicyclobacillus shizuokensis]|uniref:site-2 protease family protein n=1 Tax=Alicyclobacillus shizuokensis TaxID=392014 RepID=UPI00082F0EE0|nr:site-2 protease family protein [Alicyclobacillus shizuokensis]MCL6625539.1 site-2 protease family protein [Alicyclobacillus shizuokensis]